MPTPAANRSRFSLTIKGVSDELRVTGFSGQAEISGLYTYDISIASKRANYDLKSWLDQPVAFTLHGDPDRHIHGYIMEASHEGQGREFTDYRLTIVPRLWRLTQSKNNRIFQDKTPNQIITLLLKEHGILGADFQDHTSDAAPRPYCVQFGESDFGFVCRLMSEEGWHFHFRHQPAQTTLLMADKNGVFASKSGDPAVRYEQEVSRAHDAECIHSGDFQQQITGGAVRLGDFDFTKPGLQLQETGKGWHNSLEYYDHPGLFAEPAAGKLRAAIRLEQAECRRQTVRMETHGTLFEAGQWFHLHSHPNPALNQRYLVTRSAISGTQTQAYGEGAGSSEQPFRCVMECIPVTVNFRPPHHYRKPSIKGPHSAIVTGPKGEEIYTDQHGRIKVQFHWDREGQANETTSCWIRVSQPLSGIEWGGIAIPRIGQEVIVEFEHGDPDRPIMVGRVYNGQSLPPYALPQHKSRSVLKTLSSTGGDGYNEIRIDDQKGQEQIFLRAEKDLELRIKNSHSTWIGNDQHIQVGNEAFAAIEGDNHHSVTGALTEQTAQNLSLTVGQDLQLKVSGALVTQAGNAIHIKVGSKALIQGGMSLTVKGGAGFITLNASGVTIMGPLVRINEGGGGGSAQAANPTLPGSPGEADNAIPGAKLRAPQAAQIPLPEVIDFDKARAQLASFKQANTFFSPLVEDCPECKLAAQQAAADAATKEQETNWVGLYYAHADGNGVAGAGYTVYDASSGAELASGTLDQFGCAKVQLPLDKISLRVEYHSDPAPLQVMKPTEPTLKQAPAGWLKRMMQSGNKDNARD